MVQFEAARQNTRGRILVRAAVISEARTKAAMFYRIAAGLLLLFDAGHTSGFPWSERRVRRQSKPRTT
jgi:hypothetical protein